MTRIDTTRRDITRTAAALHELAAHIEDLHVLAYDRHKAAQQAKVSGGDPTAVGIDLDTNGDPRARDLLRNASETITHLHSVLDTTLTTVRDHLTAGTARVGRRDPSADASTDDVLGALEAARRRRGRGEYQPTPIAKQPEVRAHTNWQQECEALRGAVRKVVAGFVAEHQHCQAERVGLRRPKLRRRPQLNLLTPRERDAWRRAYEAVASRKAS